MNIVAKTAMSIRFAQARRASVTFEPQPRLGRLESSTPELFMPGQFLGRSPPTGGTAVCGLPSDLFIVNSQIERMVVAFSFGPGPTLWSRNCLRDDRNGGMPLLAKCTGSSAGQTALPWRKEESWRT